MKAFTGILILGVMILTAAPSGALEKLYFGDMGENKIIRCDLNGAGREDLVTTDIEAIGSIAIDRGAGQMYWTDWPAITAHIKRANLDGSNVVTVLPGLSGPYGIDLDVPNGKMYWTEFSAGKIRRADLDGSNIEDLVTTGLAHVGDLALDLTGGKMYWGDGTSEYSAKIQRANLDGTNVETLVTDPLVAPAGIGLDVADDRVYWADLGTGSYWRSHLDGTGLEEILPGIYDIAVAMAVDPAGGKIYVSEYGLSNSIIRRANLDGTGAQTIVYSGIGAVYALALGPAEAECTDSRLDGPWLAIVTGVEAYDYAVYMTFDGAGTIPEMGAYNVPDPAGTYDVAADCGMTGEIWSDGYVPFTGSVVSETEAEMDIGLGPMQLLKVSDPGALAGCWDGHFVFEPTGAGWLVELEIDETGSVISSSGFPGPVTGNVFTEPGDMYDYLAGLLAFDLPDHPGGAEIMFLDASAEGDSLMSGTFDMDCTDGCEGGVFELAWCATDVGNEVPVASSLGLRNHPNPFNPWTTISFRLPEPAAVTLRVYDASGRLIRTLVAEQMFDEGKGEVVWNGRNDRGAAVASGVYFTRLDAGRYGETRRMTLLK